ncbi:unnamed protein product, partial [Heterosigma akashiwo]
GHPRAAVLCGKYLLPQGPGRPVLAGATSEHVLRPDSVPNMAVALEELGPKITPLLPRLEGLTPVDCRAGTRVFRTRNALGKLPGIFFEDHIVPLWPGPPHATSTVTTGRGGNTAKASKGEETRKQGACQEEAAQAKIRAHRRDE